ncbi:AAA family ATPase [Vibrio fluvialis]|uniref:AAA family ATPase n=1 Tax=Vibrio fluvialis TaxID=676 RepID=UPI001F2DC63B|nr:AAA family ATPase [Vibrio fluvialis]MCE7587901.1 AAA family ATPase [Vibrio fluvialis]
MPILKNITVSNIRRFASDVSIPISPQATIFLAPNGTGKTALFEAIELAITGQVARLDDDIFALIKDNEAFASVSLNFDNFRQEATVTSDGKIDWNPADIINGSAQVRDISYLLRLTHLLDQRDKNWFVQEEAKEAGSLLTKLPIGQEAQKLWSMMPKLRRPIARLLSDKEQEKEKAQHELEQWDELVRERKLAQERAGTENISLEELSKDLIPFMDDSSSYELGSLERLAIEHSVCSSSVSSNLLESKGTLIALSQLTKTCEIFNESKKQEKALSTMHASSLDKKASILAERDSKLADFQASERDCEKTFTELNGRLSEKRTLEKLNTLNQKENTAKEQIVEELKKLQEHEKSKAGAKDRLVNLRTELSKHLQVEARQKDLVSSQERLNSGQSSLAVWKEEVGNVDTYKKKLSVLEYDLEAAKLASQSSKAKLDEAKESSIQNKTQLTSLQKSSDQVRSAVAEIAACISGKRGDCPVCGEEHGIDGLEERMRVQLKGVDPELQLLSELDVQLTENIAKYNQEYDISVKNEHQISIQIKEQNELINQSEIRINNSRLDPLFKSLEIEDVEQEILGLTNELLVREEQIASDASRLSERPTAEALSVAEQALEDIEHKFEQLQKSIFRLQEIVEEVRFSKAQLSSELREDLVSDNIDDEIKLLNELLVQKRATSQALKLDVEREQEKLSLITKQTSDFLAELNEARNVLSNMQGNWEKQGLINEPNLDVLKDKITEQEKSVDELNNACESLDSLRKKIAQLQGAENLKVIQKKIDQIKGNINEDTHRARLASVFSERAKELSILNEKKATLDSFQAELNQEIDQIQSKVASIEPLWQALLSRIVRESRFSQTGLQIERKWNKAHARVSVPLSNTTVSASKIASEAQKTDLQLTFLLSMALANTWSPWRALLLDDPTQHHDLVHASAIFDVLRDYILEYKFQLLMTTHDPVQANFLRRKLENDGIDVNIVNLVPSSDGVRCILNQSKSLV